MDAFTFLYERRVNPESPPCPSPCKVVVQKAESPQPPENIADHKTDELAEELGAVDAVSKDSPRKAPTLPQSEDVQGSPRSPKGSPAKASPTKVTSPISVVQAAEVTAALSPQAAPYVEETAAAVSAEAETQEAETQEETAATMEETPTQEAANEDQMTDELPTSAPMEEEEEEL